MNLRRINNNVTRNNLELERVLKDMVASAGGPVTVGNIYYVVPADNANSTQFNRLYNGTYDDGSEVVQTSLDLAMAATTAGRGDVVLVAAGYTETVTSTTPALDVAGVTVVGIGEGLNRPTFTYGAAAATINVSAANISMMNCHHVANFDNVASAFTTAAAKDFALINNTFDDTSTILHFLSIVTTSTTDQAASGLKVVGNRWNGLAIAPLAFVSILGDLDRLILNDNVAFMDATNDVGHFVTVAAKDLLEAEISNNVLIVVGATDAAVGIFLTGSGTAMKGIVRGNMVSSLDTTAELIATAGTGLDFFENYYTGTADKSGKLWPVVDAA